MAKWFSDGTVVMGILCLMALEAGVLVVLQKQWRTPSYLAGSIASIGAGAALLMAFNAALQGARWQVLAAWLVLALVCHLIDLGCRISMNSNVAGHRS